MNFAYLFKLGQDANFTYPNLYAVWVKKKEV